MGSNGQGGSDKELNELLKRVTMLAYQALRRRGATPDEAEDLAQEVAFKVWEKLKGLPPLNEPQQPNKLPRFHFRADWALADYLRSSGTRRLEAVGAVDGNDGPAPCVPARQYADFVAHQLWHFLAALSPEHQVVVGLHFVEGRTIEETGQIMGASVAKVKHAIREIRRQCQAWLTAGDWWDELGQLHPGSAPSTERPAASTERPAASTERPAASTERPSPSDVQPDRLSHDRVLGGEETLRPVAACGEPAPSPSDETDTRVYAAAAKKGVN